MMIEMESSRLQTASTNFLCVCIQDFCPSTPVPRGPNQTSEVSNTCFRICRFQWYELFHVLSRGGVCTVGNVISPAKHLRVPSSVLTTVTSCRIINGRRHNVNNGTPCFLSFTKMHQKFYVKLSVLTRNPDG